jgi:hypothetical protein
MVHPVNAKLLVKGAVEVAVLCMAHAPGGSCRTAGHGLPEVDAASLCRYMMGCRLPSIAERSLTGDLFSGSLGKTHVQVLKKAYSHERLKFSGCPQNCSIATPNWK